MKVLVNALSATNLSGRQVAAGHVVECIRQGPATLQMVVLHHAGNRDLRDRIAAEWGGPLPTSLSFMEAPSWTSHWLGRTGYERGWLPRVVHRHRIDVCLSLSGTWVGNPGCRYVTLALNPWAWVEGRDAGIRDRLKRNLQRRGYRQAVDRADAIGYGSGFMRDLYRNLAGKHERRGEIVYPGLSAIEIVALDEVKSLALPRDATTMLCVSVMARHKNIEALIDAVARLRDVHGLRARLRLVGGWPEESYRREIVELIHARKLTDAIEITGHLPRHDLYRAYATARLYVLMSRSESFGIPAIEAQRVGTPVLGTLGTAMPEVGGAGGVYIQPGDVIAAADVMNSFLTDEAVWTEASRNAVINARRFDYRLTSRSLLALLEESG